MRKNLKKKLVIGVSVGSVIILILAGIVLWSMNKTKWHEVCSMFGPFDIMQLDEKLSSNSGDGTFYIDAENEYQITGNLEILSGKVTVVYKINNKVVFEKTYGVGKYTLEKYTFENEGGEICIEWQPSDNVDGSYKFGINQRQRKMSKWIERIEENIS